MENAGRPVDEGLETTAEYRPHLPGLILLGSASTRRKPHTLSRSQLRLGIRWCSRRSCIMAEELRMKDGSMPRATSLFDKIMENHSPRHQYKSVLVSESKQKLRSWAFLGWALGETAEAISRASVGNFNPELATLNKRLTHHRKFSIVSCRIIQTISIFQFNSYSFPL